jgi:hypothetical protein
MTHSDKNASSMACTKLSVSSSSTRWDNRKVTSATRVNQCCIASRERARDYTKIAIDLLEGGPPLALLAVSRDDLLLRDAPERFRCLALVIRSFAKLLDHPRVACTTRLRRALP